MTVGEMRVDVQGKERGTLLVKAEGRINQVLQGWVEVVSSWQRTE